LHHLTSTSGRCFCISRQSVRPCYALMRSKLHHDIAEPFHALLPCQ
jgi:hypothetical protein